MNINIGKIARFVASAVIAALADKAVDRLSRTRAERIGEPTAPEILEDEHA